jgi:transcriptional regulator with XRE-family HTH domain
MAEDFFGEIVKRERKKQDLSLAQLSKEIENQFGEALTPSASYINRLETGDKVNPSFKIVCMLCQVLSLDVREVFGSFGFAGLIKGVNPGEFSIEELIRLHKIQQPNDKFNDGILSIPQKEILLAIIQALFDYSIPEKIPVDMLPFIITEINRFREVQQESFQSEMDDVRVNYLGTELTFRMGPLCKAGWNDLKEWREEIIRTLDKRGVRLLDIPTGTILFPLGDQLWLASKNGYTITFLSNQTNIISL